MKLLVVAVRDSAAGAFMRPFYLSSPGQAIRSFQDEVNRASEENTMFHHPEDFELFELGTFDDGTGLFDLLAIPKSLCTAKQLKVALDSPPVRAVK